MAKAEFARGKLEYGGNEIGVFDVSINSSYSEIDVTDTLTTLSESDFLGARQSHTITFSSWKLAGSADIVLNLTSSNTCVVTVLSASAGDDTLYTGALVLLSKDVTGNIDGAVQLTYTGKIVGALVETQPA